MSMSKGIYFVRHGESEWNVANKICGSTDIALTDKGRQQAKATAQAFLDSSISADKILYSPLSRAKETALIISAATGIPAEEEPRLTEQCFGRYEGRPRNDAEFYESKKSLADRYGDGESMLMLAHRIYGLLDDLKGQDAEYILVAHNGIARCVNSYFNSLTNDEYASYGVKNCEIVRFEWI